MPPEEARIIQRTLVEDSTFLCSHNIMDYSLLVGVHRTVQHFDRDLLHGDLAKHAGTALANDPSFLTPRSISGNVGAICVCKVAASVACLCLPSTWRSGLSLAT